MDHSLQMILADFVSMFFVDKECCILSVVGKNQTNECIFVCVTLANDNSVWYNKEKWIKVLSNTWIIISLLQ